MNAAQQPDKGTSPLSILGLLFRSVPAIIFLCAGFVLAVNILIEDRDDHLVSIRQQLVKQLPALHNSTDKEGQPEILINQRKMTALPQQQATGQTFQEAKESTGQEFEENEQQTETAGATGHHTDDNFELPSAINLDVPFFPQAPDADWTLPRKEACEEASITLAAYFLNEINPEKDRFKADILRLVALQQQLFGDYIDTDIKETELLFNRYFGIGDSYILEDPTIEQLKRELAQGHPIVAPFAGRELGNSHFTNGGPRYHMLVIRGYDDTYFYTNDVGTRHGENFPYTHDVLMNALHDLTVGDITDGEKNVLVLQKELQKSSQ